jgi:hypothetical protein
MAHILPSFHLASGQISGSFSTSVEIGDGLIARLPAAPIAPGIRRLCRHSQTKSGSARPSSARQMRDAESQRSVGTVKIARL